MSKGRFLIPEPVNEPVRAYAPGSNEAKSLHKTIEQLQSEVIEIHSVIGGKRITSDKVVDFTGPSDHKHVLAKVHHANT